MVVARLDAQTVRVNVDKNDACSGCSMRCTCNPVGTQKMAFAAQDTLQSQVGDEVDVTFEPASRRWAIAILYGVPLVAFITGAGVGNALALFGSADISGVVLSLAATAAALAGVRWYSKRYYETNATYRPVIVQRYPGAASGANTESVA